MDRAADEGARTRVRRAADAPLRTGAPERDPCEARPDPAEAERLRQRAYRYSLLAAKEAGSKLALQQAERFAETALSLATGTLERARPRDTRHDVLPRLRRRPGVAMLQGGDRPPDRHGRRSRGLHPADAGRSVRGRARDDHAGAGHDAPSGLERRGRAVPRDDRPGRGRDERQRGAHTAPHRRLVRPGFAPRRAVR